MKNKGQDFPSQHKEIAHLGVLHVGAELAPGITLLLQCILMA